MWGYSRKYGISMIKARRLRWIGYVTCIEKIRNGYKILVGKRELKRALGRPRCRWEDNIKIDLEGIGERV
jgi:hypothetical protein